MSLELTLEEGWRLEDALKKNEKVSKCSGRRTLTEEREKKIVSLIQEGKMSQADIVRSERVSHKTIIQIRKKYHIWGA